MLHCNKRRTEFVDRCRDWCYVESYIKDSTNAMKSAFCVSAAWEVS